MKKIEAIVRHHKLDPLKVALHEKGASGLTVTEVRGFGRQKGHVEAYRGVEYVVDLLPKIKVEVAVADELVPIMVQTIMEVTRTGEIGDGKIFVTPLVECVRIRTGDSGDSAL